MRDPVIVYHVEVIAETEKAFLISHTMFDGRRRAQSWLPKSHVSSGSVAKKPGDTGDLICSRWIARTKGLDYEEIESPDPEATAPWDGSDDWW